MDTTTSASEIATRLDLSPHPEGGWYRETHRASEQVEWQGRRRATSTSILFLLDHPQVSHLHRIDAEEIWFWHAGSELLIQEIRPDGTHREHRLGPQGSFQVVIPAGSWFGAELAQPETWCLVGCAVSPGFEFAGFELGRAEDLLREFPVHAAMIRRLTPGPGSD